MGKHVAIDFDGTIVNYDGNYRTGVYDEILPGALEFVLKLKANGHRVTIFTARGNPKKVSDYLVEKGFPRLTVTCEKSGFDMFIDDRAIPFPGPSFYNNIDDAVKAVEEFKPWWAK
jgi:hypothetical protein